MEAWENVKFWLWSEELLSSHIYTQSTGSDSISMSASVCMCLCVCVFVGSAILYVENGFVVCDGWVYQETKPERAQAIVSCSAAYRDVRIGDRYLTYTVVCVRTVETQHKPRQQSFSENLPRERCWADNPLPPACFLQQWGKSYCYFYLL